MAIKLGPILSFCGNVGNEWRLSVLVATDGLPVAVSHAERALSETLLHQRDKLAVYRYSLIVPLGKKPSRIVYEVDGKSFEVAVPGAEMPRAAYASCNGFSAMKYMKGIKDNNALWSRMQILHQATPYNLLLLGGDQVYADSMWETLPSLQAWAKLGWDKGNKASFTAKMEADLQRFYEALYCDRWSLPEVAYMLARVPMIAMWDNHDLIDGWGSYPVDRQTCAVFTGIGRAATSAFRLFQQQLAPDERKPTALGGPDVFSMGFKVGALGILALDMRSERNLNQVLSLAHWDAVYSWMDANKDLKHLLIMSSIPVVYPGFDTLEQLLGAMPGYQDLEDDLRDHWNSRPHKNERIRLINRLLAHSRATGIRTTIVSGDVHVGALGVIEAYQQDGTVATVDQLIASGIVHPSPNAVVLFCLKHLFKNIDELEGGIVAKMVDFPGQTTRFIGHRNFLSLEPDDQSRIWANWIVENEEHPYTKVIHPRSGGKSRWAAR